MKKLSIYITISFLALNFFSCKKSLNELPPQSKVEGNVIIDQKSAEVALNGVYYRFAEAGDDRGVQSTQTSYTHEKLPSSLAGFIENRTGASALNMNAVTPTAYDAAYIWESAYLLINAANSVIKDVQLLPSNKIQEQRRNEILGEAYFMRAYGHYQLMAYYAQYFDVNSPYGVMIRDEPVTTSNIPATRKSVQESYDFILADVDKAIQDAPSAQSAKRVTSWTAKALKARILLNRGLESDFTEVVTLTKDIIANSPYLLEDHQEDIFKTKGLSSSEVMLGTVPFAAQVNKRDSYLYRDLPADIVKEPLSEIMNGDPRVAWCFHTVSDYLGISKFLGEQVEVGYMFRLTEVYLQEAEALLRSNGDIDEVKGLMKTVMGKAGITDFGSLDAITDRDELRMELYAETVRNLFCEDGQDWQALLRLPMAKIQELRPTIVSNTQFILPIPLVEFQRNPMIGDQNPGYIN